MYNVRFTLAVIIVTLLCQLLTDTEIKRNNYVHTKSPISRKTDKAVLPFFPVQVSTRVSGRCLHTS